jgi:protein-S-isoprenylcysteine O-methyltransferase Ste14
MSGRPPVWAVVGTMVAAPLFIGTVVFYVPYALSGWRFAPPLLGWEPTRWIGAGLLALALPVMVDFILRFVLEGHGTPVPVAPPQRLVVRGMFRFVRNPAYLAAVSAIVGQGLLFGNTRVLAYALFMALAFHLLVVGYEEPTLRRKFGMEYEAYRREVPRWVPRIPRG